MDGSFWLIPLIGFVMLVFTLLVTFVRFAAHDHDPSATAPAGDVTG